MDCYQAIDAKNIAKTIDCPAWKAIDEQQLEELNIAKFEQDPILLTALLSSEKRLLLECTTCPHWGIGAGLKSKALREQDFRGKNRGGEVLMKARKHLAEKYPSTPPSPAQQAPAAAVTTTSTPAQAQPIDITAAAATTPTSTPTQIILGAQTTTAGIIPFKLDTPPTTTAPIHSPGQTTVVSSTVTPITSTAVKAQHGKGKVNLETANLRQRFMSVVTSSKKKHKAPAGTLNTSFNA